MRTVLEELEIYKNNVRLAKSTITNYTFYLKKFISYLSAEMNNPTTIYLHQIYELKDSAGKFLRFLPIDSAFIDNYFLSINHKSFNVLKDNYKSLTSFFKFIENNYGFENPMYNLTFNLKDYLPEKKFTKVLTRGNILKFINSIITHSNNLTTELLLFTILISTGCRISEILNLKFRDIHFNDDTFLLETTKTKQERIVFLRPGMGYEIQNYMRNFNRNHYDHLFLKENMKKYTRRDVDNLLKKYLNLANVPTINIHGLRHTFATLMADQATPLDIIRQFLGHESLSSTRGYINPHYIRNKDFKMPENKIIIDYINSKHRDFH